MTMDRSLIKLCATACQQAYDDLSPSYKFVQDLRYGIRELEDLDCVIVAIRGTDNVHNVIRDCSVIPASSPNGYHAHGGFVHAYHCLCDGGMISALARYKRSKVIATGHSMGGAIATLLAENIGCRLVTFGSPRVYFRWSSVPQLDHLRIVCDDDPVPDLPRLLYKHTCEPVVWRDNDCRLIEVEDHYMANYLARLEVCSV